MEFNYEWLNSWSHIDFHVELDTCISDIYLICKGTQMHDFHVEDSVLFKDLLCDWFPCRLQTRSVISVSTTQMSSTSIIDSFTFKYLIVISFIYTSPANLVVNHFLIPSLTYRHVVSIWETTLCNVKLNSQFKLCILLVVYKM